MNDKTASTPTTPLACPDWCDNPPNESFDTEIATGQSIRFHDHVATRGDGFTVWFAALERITPDGLMTEPITIGIDQSGSFDGPSWLTPTQARGVAAALLSAADEAEGIEAMRVGEH